MYGTLQKFIRHNNQRTNRTKLTIQIEFYIKIKQSQFVCHVNFLEIETADALLLPKLNIF